MNRGRPGISKARYREDWSPSLGASVEEAATTFRVWAPGRERVELVLEPADLPRTIHPLSRDDEGYWYGRFEAVRAGARYRFRLDGRDDLTFPDPASRSQPDGVHRASAAIDPGAFRWTDGGWVVPPLEDLTIYELHVGTFSPEGTFGGAIDRLPYLVGLGVSAIELMPVGDFPGDRNWGYDGVSLFAPARCYGTPDDLRALVDAAHSQGLAVILDVVYNHLGPDGAYAHAFSPFYFTNRHHTAWGAAINLDGPHSAPVRRFIIENALHWIREYHMDGLRLDATHALHDDSSRHILAELSDAIRAYGGRRVHIVAEDHRNLARMMKPVEAGGFGLDAVWADDFHHQVRVHIAGDRESYYSDYTGTMPDLAMTMRQGWFFTGQQSGHRGRPRGTNPEGLSPARFVYCIQNHDQIGNRADGARLNHEVDAATFRAASTLLLLAPQTPMLFMGQEWAASSPFLFFTDHHEELGRLVTQGRREEFGGFAAFSTPASRDAIPDPQDVGTFERSRLAWDEALREPHAGTLRLYRRLLALRRLLPQRAGSRDFDVRALDGHTVLLTLAPQASHPVHVAVRLSGAGRVPLPAFAMTPHEVLLSTEDAEFAADALPIRHGPDDPAELSSDAPFALTFHRPGAIVMRRGPA